MLNEAIEGLSEINRWGERSHLLTEQSLKEKLRKSVTFT